LDVLYCPRGIGRGKFKSYARNAQRITYVTGEVIDKSNLNEVSMKLFYDHSRVFDEAFFMDIFLIREHIAPTLSFRDAKEHRYE
jgi:hypothetical protein